MPHTWCSPIFIASSCKPCSPLVVILLHSCSRSSLIALNLRDSRPTDTSTGTAPRDCGGYVACVILVRNEVGVASWEERQEDLIEHESLSQPAQTCGHGCVLVLSEAVVELEIQGSGQPFRTPVELKCEPVLCVRLLNVAPGRRRNDVPFVNTKFTC